MLTSIKGIYKNGVIKPLEKIKAKGEAKVIITFLNIPVCKKEAFLSSAGSWKDFDTEKFKKEIYKLRSISTRKRVIF